MQQPHHGLGPGHDVHDLAVALEPAIRQACAGRLGPVTWFRSAWSSSGSATGSAEWTDERGPRLAIVKLPVGPVEYRWTTGLGKVEGAPAARVLASGEHAGANGAGAQGHEIAWVVTERARGEPLATRLDERAVHELIATIADFHAAASAVRPVDERPKPVDWAKHIAEARECVRTHGLAEGQRWNEALKHVERHLPAIAARWENRPLHVWCHGDVHPGNVIRAVSADGSPARCILIDLALVHAGHWLEDAVYLERQYWGHAEMLCGVKPVPLLAKMRRERGLPADDNYGDLANVRRVLMASLVPLFVDREGNAKYVHAALETIERVLPQVR